MNLLGNILFYFLMAIAILLAILIIAVNIIRIQSNRKLKKEAERLLKESQQNFNYWVSKLEEEHKSLQDAMNIFNRQYHENVIEKRRNETPPKSE